MKGEGCELTSLDGDKYVDFLGEYSAGIYGHSNREIAGAVTDAMKDGWNFGGPNRYERELARKVSLHFPLKFNLFFGMSVFVTFISRWQSEQFQVENGRHDVLVSSFLDLLSPFGSELVPCLLSLL